MKGFEQAIKTAIREGSVHALKRITIEKVDVIGTYTTKVSNDEDGWAVVFSVTIAHSAPKYENNHTVFKVLFYSDGTTSAYYVREYSRPKND
jgi:hypothetical protein